MSNVAEEAEYAKLKARLSKQLLEWCRQQGDKDGVSAMLKPDEVPG